MSARIIPLTKSAPKLDLSGYQARKCHRIGDQAEFVAKELVELAATAGLSLGVDITEALVEAEAISRQPIDPDQAASVRSKIRDRQRREADLVVIRALKRIDVEKLHTAAKRKVTTSVKTATQSGFRHGVSLEDAARQGKAALWLAVEDADKTTRAVWELFDVLRQNRLAEPTFVRSGDRAVCVPIAHRYLRPEKAKMTTSLLEAVTLGLGPGLLTPKEAMS